MSEGEAIPIATHHCDADDDASSLQEQLRQCKLGWKCLDKASAIFWKCTICNNEWIHPHCLRNLLRFVNHPNDEATDNDAVCSRRCFSKLLRVKKAANGKKIKRMFWHNDGPNPEINSLSVLLEWLNTENNYNRWRGGDRQSGVTKLSLCNEILELIKERGIKTVRTAKDVHHKITNIEMSYRKADDWKRATGAGIQDEKTVKDEVKKICPYYYELEDVFSSRVTHPITQSIESSSSSDEAEDAVDDEEIEPEGQEVASGVQAPENLEVPGVPQTSTSPLSGGTSSRSGQVVRRLHLSARKRKSPPQNRVEGDEMFALRKEQFIFEQAHKTRMEERAAKELESQMTLNNWAAKELDSKVGLNEAQQAKLQKETAKLQEETESLKISKLANLLRERQKLLEEGVNPADIDRYLPLPP